MYTYIYTYVCVCVNVATQKYRTVFVIVFTNPVKELHKIGFAGLRLRHGYGSQYG